MKAFLSLLIISFLSSFSYSQTCLPEGIIFTSQAQVDSFQINYPGCTIIEGDLTIGPENSWDEIDISNLDSLIVLTSIEGDLKAWNNDLLADLTGLDSLSIVDGDLIIETNSSIESLLGLENLESVGGMLQIYGGNYITSLNGINNLGSIGGNLVISYNNALNDITALTNLTTIAGEFIVTSNASLSTLSGLDNIEESSITSMVISSNANLSMCSIESVCAYLAEGSWGINIANNTSGCDNVSQVNDACLTIGVEEESSLSFLSVYPNPVKDDLFFSTSSNQSINKIIIYNQIGQQMEMDYNLNNRLDVSSLKSGIYYLEIINDERIIREMFIIERN